MNELSDVFFRGAGLVAELGAQCCYAVGVGRAGEGALVENLRRGDEAGIGGGYDGDDRVVLFLVAGNVCLDVGE